MSGSEWADPLGDLRRAARKVAAAPRRMPLDPALVSMTPEVEQKLAAPPLRLFPDMETGFPIMERMVREVMKREDDEWREALRKLRAEETPAHPREEQRMGDLLVVADGYADRFRMTLDEALGIFAELIGLEK